MGRASIWSFERVLKAGVLLGATAGIGLLALGLVGYALGLNDGFDTRTQSNFVPGCLFGGIGLLLIGGIVTLCVIPESLPRPSAWLGVLILAICGWLGVGLYIKAQGKVITLPVDLVTGPESQFVDHIIRFRAGQPQYTAVEDANTSPYTPGAPLLTYAIAWALERPTSIATFRLIQQLYLVLAALLAAAAARGLFRFCRPESRLGNLWLLFWIPFLYLAASNPQTNPYTHALNCDGLALTVNALAFWLLTRHFITQDDRWLAAMAVVPALGFLVKQKEMIWAALYVLYLFLAGPRRLRRTVVFGLAAVGAVGLAIGACYALWGMPFIFWTFQPLGAQHVSLSRNLEQFTGSAWYVVMGLCGGALLLRAEMFGRLLPLWACWLLHLLVSVYTSGVAERPAHIGPASLIAAAWFLVGVARIWPESSAELKPVSHRAELWWRAPALVGFLLVLLTQTRPIRVGFEIPGGLKRYIAEIEREFEGKPRDRVLLDRGSWVYLPYNVVMKDRGSPIGTLAGTRTSDFRMTVERLRSRHYDKLLIRKTESGEFLFQPEAISQAISDNYQETRVIRSPGAKGSLVHGYVFLDISVLEPKRD